MLRADGYPFLATDHIIRCSSDDGWVWAELVSISQSCDRLQPIEIGMLR